MILIVASDKDVASLNIRSQILKNYDFKETSEKIQSNPVYKTEAGNREIRLVTLDVEPVHSQEALNATSSIELAVFISRHSSASGTPTLSVHTPGNFGDAEMGGLPKKVSISPANSMRDTLKAMMKMKEEMDLQYEVSYECTHHGPSLDVPAMFAELGSGALQWGDSTAAESVAHSVMEAMKHFKTSNAKAVAGIGGPHYNSRFTRMALEKDLAFGHIVPKYAVSKVDGEILRQCVERSLEKVDRIVLDWKGIIGNDKPPLIKVLEESGLPFEKT